MYEQDEQMIPPTKAKRFIHCFETVFYITACIFIAVMIVLSLLSLVE
jgi:hypothetical protein